MSRRAMGVIVGIGVLALVAGIVFVVRERGEESERETVSGAARTASHLETVEGSSGQEVALTLQGSARARAGIVTEALSTRAGGSGVRLTGEVIADPGRTTIVQAPVAGRLMAVDGGHWPTLSEHVDAGAVLGQISDAKPLTAPRSGTVTSVAAQPGQAVQPGQTLLELTDFATPLARIVWRPDAPFPPPASVTLAPLVGAVSRAAHGAVRARLVGTAATVDSLTGFPVCLYRAERTWPGARPGLPVVATIAGAGAPEHGVFVPAAAMVQWQGLSWVYVERDTSQYVRERLDTSHPLDGGWLVSNAEGVSRLTAGDRVVVRGAQQLLSEEFRSRAVVGEADDAKDNK